MRVSFYYQGKEGAIVNLPENDVELDSSGILALQNAKFLVLKKNVGQNSYVPIQVEVVETGFIHYKRGPFLYVLVRDVKEAKPLAFIE